MIKRVIVSANFFARFLIQENQPDYDSILKANIERMKEAIWNKIQSLKKEDMKDLIVEIKDWNVL